jgi:3D (Asp-Asp-Asp) domain-containing protein
VNRGLYTINNYTITGELDGGWLNNFTNNYYNYYGATIFHTTLSPGRLTTISYYADAFHGKTTASGDTFDMYSVSAAHKTLPFGTFVEFFNPSTSRAIVAVVNDRGPYIDGREFDLSYEAARQLGIIEDGVAKVWMRIVRWPDNYLSN